MVFIFLYVVNLKDGKERFIGKYNKESFQDLVYFNADVECYKSAGYTLKIYTEVC